MERPYIYSQLIFKKHTKEIHWRNDSLLNKWFWYNKLSTWKGKKKEKTEALPHNIHKN